MEFTKINKLDYETCNYRVWKNTLMGCLKSENLWNITKGLDQKPEPTPENMEEISKWNKKDERASGVIIKTLSVTEINYVEEEESAAELWTKLENRHVSKLSSDVENALYQLEDLKKTSDCDIMKYVEKFKNLYQQYLNVGGKDVVKNELELIRLFFRGLLYEPGSPYKAFRMTIDTSSQIMDPSTGKMVRNLITFENVILRLRELTNSLPQVDQPMVNLTEDKMQTPNGRLFSKKAGRWDPSLKCTNCGGVGHPYNACSSATKPPTSFMKFAEEEMKKRRDQRHGKENKPLDEHKNFQTGTYKQQESIHMTEEGWFTPNEEEEGYFTQLTNGKIMDDTFLDNCCSTTIFNDTIWFEKLIMYEKPGPMGTIFGSQASNHEIMGEGQVNLSCLHEEGWSTLILKRALYVPSAKRNLVSQGQIIRECGVQVVNVEGGSVITRGNHTIGDVEITTNNLYRMKGVKPCGNQNETVNFVQAKANIPITLAHARFGHVNYSRMIKHINSVEGLVLSNKTCPISCIVCQVAKSKALPHKRYNTNKEYNIMELIVGDFKSFNDGTGIFILKCVATNFTRTFRVKSKAEQQTCFEQYLHWVSNVHEKNIKFFRHDKGTEYMNIRFQTYLLQKGIEDQTTAGYSPESNGIAESQIRTLDMIAKGMLTHAQLEKEWWPQAMITASYIYNRTPDIEGYTPIERLTGRKPRVDQFRVFGCQAIVHIPKAKRIKSDIPGYIGRFVGYGSNSLTYKIWDGVNHIFVESRDVKFNEDVFTFNEGNGSETKEIWIPLTPDQLETIRPNKISPWQITNEQGTNDQHQEHQGQDLSTDNASVTTEYHTPYNSPVKQLINETNANESYHKQLSSDLGNYWIPKQGSRRERGNNSDIDQKIDSLFTEHIETHRQELAMIGEEVSKVPKSYQEMKSLIDQEQWHEAMEKELQSLEEMKVHELQRLDELPENAQILPSLWLFSRTVKTPYKARILARGDLDNMKFDLVDTFSTVTRLENFKLLISFGVYHNLQINSVDFKTAFLNAPLQHTRYMRIPPRASGDRNTYCWKLKKALYGLPEAPLAWNQELSHALTNLGFTRLEKDWNIFVYRNEKELIVIGFHVDDGLVFYSSQQKWSQLLDQLQEKYKLTVNTDPDIFLGINLILNQPIRAMHQMDYIVQAANSFDVAKINAVRVPMDPSFVMHTVDTDMPVAPGTPYRSIIGCLQSIARVTRPDVLYAVNIVSMAVNCPMIRHWKAAKRVLAYIHQTRDLVLTIGRFREVFDKVVGFSDATWADDILDRKSRTGGCIFIYGTLVSCWTKKQSAIALSSMEAEYQAMSSAAQEIVYFRNLLQELGINLDKPSILFADNRAALDFLVSTKNHPKVKHIALKYHYTRNCVSNKILQAEHVSTEAQIADIFTKALCWKKFQKFQRALGLSRCNFKGGIEIDNQEVDVSQYIHQ